MKAVIPLFNIRVHTFYNRIEIRGAILKQVLNMPGHIAPHGALIMVSPRE